MAAKAAMKQQQGLVTGRQLAAILGVNPVTVRRWVLKGHIPTYQTGPGGRHRFDVDEVKQALRDRGAEGGSEG